MKTKWQKLMEGGTHWELLMHKSAYAALWQKQFPSVEQARV